MSPNPLISLCFSLSLTLILLIAAFAVTLTVLIAAYAVSTCDRGIFPLRKSIAMTSFSLTNFRHFNFRQLFPLVRDRFRYTTHAWTLCKWAGACRNRPRTPGSQHAWYDFMLGQRWLRWLGNESTINTVMTDSVDEGMDGSALFPSAIIILVIFFIIAWCFVLLTILAINNIVLLFNYRSELLVAHSVTVFQSVKIALKRNETEFTKTWNGKSIFLKRKIIGPTQRPNGPTPSHHHFLLCNLAYWIQIKNILTRPLATWE